MTDERAGQAIAERLLLGTLPDLRARTEHGASTYELLGAAAILRRTVVERHRLIDVARARLRLPRPMFSYSPFHPPAATSTPGAVRVLGFARSFEVQDVTTGIDPFLTAPAASFRSTPVSVRRVIRYFANVHGGVHLGHPKDEFERTLQWATASIPIAEQMWMQTIRSIAVVTVAALEPIAEAIAADPLSNEV